MADGKRGRPRIEGRKTSFLVHQDVCGWVEFRATIDGTMTDYFNALVREDRDGAISEGGELLQRYRAYLVAMGMTSELEALDAIIKTEA